MTGLNNLEHFVGEVIRTQRIQRGLSQEKLAELGEFERSYISKVENGERAIRIETFIRFAHAFNMSPVDLMQLLVNAMNTPRR